MKISLRKQGLLVTLLFAAVFSLRSDVITDTAVTIVNLSVKVKSGGKITFTDLAGLNSILKLIPQETLGTNIVGAKTPIVVDLPKEIIKKGGVAQGIAIEGSILFNKKAIDCKVIFGRAKDSTGAEIDGYSLIVSLPNRFKVKDLQFIKSLGVSDAQMAKFGDIDLPEGRIIFSNFAYSDQKNKFQVNPGITISSKTRVAALVGIIKAEVNRLTDGQGLPFIARVQNNEPVLFNLALGFDGGSFKSVEAKIGLPMELGVDFQKLRADESRFSPNIAAPFKSLNQPIKEVTSILNKSPLNNIREASISHFMTSIKVESRADFALSFGAEFNMTLMNGDIYGLFGKIAIAPDQLAIELQKSPSIASMPLGSGVEMEDISLSLVTNYAALAAGTPISGFGIMGAINFPFDRETVSVILGAKINPLKAEFLLLGQLQGLSVSKIAQFNGQLIQIVGKKVGFDGAKLNAAMSPSNFPRIVINDGRMYFASADMTMGDKKYPLGFGAGLKVTVSVNDASYVGSLSMSANSTKLAAEGLISPIKTSEIIITGPGPDKKYDTSDDGLGASFVISTDIAKSNFSVAGRVILPWAGNLMGQGSMLLSTTKIKGDFKVQYPNLFAAMFNADFNPVNPITMAMGFKVVDEERGKFMNAVFADVKNIINEKKDVVGNALRAVQADLDKAEKSTNYEAYKSQKAREASNKRFNDKLAKCKKNISVSDPVPKACVDLAGSAADFVAKGLDEFSKKSTDLVTKAAQQAFDAVNDLNEKIELTKKSQASVQAILNTIVNALQSAPVVLPSEISAQINVAKRTTVLSIKGASINLPAPVGKLEINITNLTFDLKNPQNSIRSVALNIFDNIKSRLPIDAKTLKALGL